MEVPSMMTALTTGQRNILSRAYNGVTKKDIGHGVSISQISTPQISSNELLVKVKTVAQNPTDWKHIDFISPPGVIMGCDYAGEVAQVGSEAVGSWKVGDRIAGVVYGGKYKDQGAYAEYTKVQPDIAWRIPDNISDHDAVTYGVSSITCMQALYYTLGFPWPDSDNYPASNTGTILVYAGSTAAGLCALQMASHAGWRVVTTCSPHSFDLCKRYGANATFDYHSSTLAEDIKSQYPDINCALDCVGGSADICGEVMAENGGKVVCLLAEGKNKTPGVENITIMAYTLMGEGTVFKIPLGPTFVGTREEREALGRYYKILPRMTEWLRPLPVQVIEGGFEGIEKGLDMLRSGKVSGKKLVVDLDKDSSKL